MPVGVNPNELVFGSISDTDRFRKDLEAAEILFVRLIDVPLAVGAAHHVIDRPRIFHSQLARHCRKLSNHRASVKTLV